MSNQPEILRPLVLRAVQLKLELLLDAVPAITGAFLATDDGFEITQVVSGKDMEPARLAAMCSSMVALSHALVEESALGESENLLIEAQRGKILLLTVPTSPKLSLTVIATPNATLGQVLVQSKMCVAQIREIMRLA
jgi:uncharacterized protein